MAPETTTPADVDARERWHDGYDVRSQGTAATALAPLPPPPALSAEAGRGHVTLRWEPVPGAAGYLVHRAEPGGPLTPLDHHGGDVLAVPGPPHVDTTGEPGQAYDYAVATVVEVTVPARTGDRVRAASLGPTEVPVDDHPPRVDLLVRSDDAGTALHRPWRPMVGSERLSQLLSTERTGTRPIGVELLAALRRVHDEIGVAAVRAHAILHDDLGVYTEVAGLPVHDFSRVDAVYDLVLSTGLRPVVEIGFMPTALASDPDSTVFAYLANNSPPRDDARWAELITALVLHLMDRYGSEVVADWDFEVWNEANIEPFWNSTRERWLAFYDITAAAVRAADPALRVGGPSSAASGWVDDLLSHVARSGSPVDFVSTHVYGSPPLDLRPALARHGRTGTPLLWTEWGVTPTHFAPVNDSVSAGTFLLTGMRSAAGRIEALSPWVASDHFEELGRPPCLLHGGFGLLSVGGIAKPRFHALAMLAALGDTELPVTATGDGADGLVQTWASRHDDGRLSILVWAHTLDQTKADGDPTLARRVRVQTGRAGDSRVTLTRLDSRHGDLRTVAAAVGVGDWPDSGAQWEALRSADVLTAEPVAATDGVVEFDLPQPGAVLVSVDR